MATSVCVNEYKALNRLTGDDGFCQNAGFSVAREERRFLDMPVPDSLGKVSKGVAVE